MMLPDLLRIVCYFLVLGGCIWIYSILKKRNLPPGPYGLPIVGYALFLGTKDIIHVKLFQLGQKYGPIYSIQLGSKLCVILTTGNAIRNVLSKAELSSRLVLPFTELSNVLNPFFDNGALWYQHRNFLVKVLRKIRTSKPNIEDIISDEAQDYMAIIERSLGKPVDIHEPLSLSLFNVTSLWALGKKLSIKNQILLNNTLQKAFDIFVKMVIFAIFPWMSYLPFFRKMNQQHIQGFQEMNENINSTLKKQLVEQKPDRTNYINMYRMEMEARSADSSSTFDDAAQLGSVTSLYAAANISVLASMEWCFYTLAAFPEMQHKLHEEIDEIIGRQNLPTIADQARTPFTQSFLLEVQRYYTITPTIWPRIAIEEFEVMGYTIPKGTPVIANLYALHHDPTVWNKAEEFIADRFINSDTKSVQKPDNYLPFAFGRRNCPGENLAYMEIFCYLVQILQKFEIRIPDGETIDLKGVITIVYGPKPQKLCFIKRV